MSNLARVTSAAGPGLPADQVEEVGLVRAVLLATLLNVAINAATLTNTRVSMAGVREQQVLHDLGEHLAGALGFLGVVSVWRRFGPRARWTGWSALATVLVVIAIPTVGQDAAGFAARFDSDAVAHVLGVAIVGGVALSVVVAAGLASWLAKKGPAWSMLALLAAFVALVGNHYVLPGDYPAAHLYLVLAGLAALSPVLAAQPLPRWWPRMIRRLPWAIGAGLAAFALLVRPSNTVQLELLKAEGSVLAPYLGRLRGGQSSADAGQVPEVWAPWFERRETTAPIAASGPPMAENLVVVLITIDSLRADLFIDAANDQRLPNFAALRDASVYFTAARAPGSQTVYSLSELFAGIYFSQQFWSPMVDNRDRWPDDDPTPRFPEFLTAAGVSTINIAGARWLGNQHGVVRGFAEEELAPPRERCFYATSDEQLPRLFARLDANQGRPAFLYLHLLDAHFNLCPIRVGARSRRFVDYLDRLAEVDAKLGALRARIEQGDLAGRTVLIVSSDHGEAFGEHGAYNHRHNLYEELLRVPLFVYSPQLTPRRVDTPVSLIDLGPTILDLFGLPTPGHNLGQSLRPLLTGHGPAPTRPLIAEGQLKKAMLFPDGLKAIVDDRNYTLEVYDLAADRSEDNNLVDRDDPRAMARIDTLRRFFKVHQIRRPGYRIPYRQ